MPRILLYLKIKKHTQMDNELNAGSTEIVALEPIARIIGDVVTGSLLEDYLTEAQLQDNSGHSTKWRRIMHSFNSYKINNDSYDKIFKFIRVCMSPSRFVERNEEFESQREKLNRQLRFLGKELTEEGQLIETAVASTVIEAEQRANSLKVKLENRNAHSKIFQFCSAELLAENYFHTVFEATKSVAEVIRNKSGLDIDGNALVNRAFSIDDPLIKINRLQTETEKNQHKGFANLIRGVLGMFRNTTAHTPRYIWTIEENDALDVLSTISLIHRTLEIEI
jgi:uncharacterized protein (TIGR02391 family)